MLQESDKAQVVGSNWHFSYLLQLISCRIWSQTPTHNSVPVASRNTDDVTTTTQHWHYNSRTRRDNFWLARKVGDSSFELTERSVAKRYIVSLLLFYSGGPAVMCIMGLKLLRSSFSDCSRQHLVLLWTVLFFHFDYRHSSETFVVDYFFMSIFMNKVRVH